MTKQWSAGFTLLEVMVALAILAITLTVLYGSQSQSLSFSTEAKFNTYAAFLIEEKLSEIQAGEIEVYNTSGDFGDDYPEYRWKMTVDSVSVTDPDVFAKISDLRKITLTVYWEDSPYTLSLDYYYQVQE